LCAISNTDKEIKSAVGTKNNMSFSTELAQSRHIEIKRLLPHGCSKAVI
jgi:hypothetical protein